MTTLPKTVRVFGYRLNTSSYQSWWNETGIFVTEGDTIVFDTSNNTGTNNPGFGDDFGPDGDNYRGQDSEDTKVWPYSLAWVDNESHTQCWFGSLIGKIGTAGIAFCIGSSASITANATGCLYLAFNDGSNFEDNDQNGYWDVDVTYEECVQISDTYGTNDRIFLNRINTDLLNDWGVILTVQCDTTDVNAVWGPTERANVVAAFTLINDRLEDLTTLSFKDVFGGLELRMVDDLGPIGGRTLNENVVRFGDVGRAGGERDNNPPDWGIANAPGYPSYYGLSESGDIGIRNTIIHELGHVFYERSSLMWSWAGTFNLHAVYANPEEGTYWENNDPVDGLGEYLPDHFLNWVLDTYISADPDVYDPNDPGPSDNEQRISAFWVGGSDFVEGTTNRGTSPGIQGFAEDANTTAQAQLEILEQALGCIDPL